MARASNVMQLLVSVAVVGLFWLLYPGVMVLFATAVGLVFVAASVGALRGSSLAGRIAFGLSITTLLLATLGVIRFVGNGFSYASGNFASVDGVYWPPYAFLAIAIGAAFVVLMRVASVRRSGDERQS